MKVNRLIWMLSLLSPLEFCALGGVTNSTIFSFNSTNGATPQAGLVQGTDGSFYGTTHEGGAKRWGTVFRITSGGNLTTLVSFDYDNGANPAAGLIQGIDGWFYGTTFSGGFGCGTVFRLSATGTFTNLYSFVGGDDGCNPFGGVVQGMDGSFYGTTLRGGAHTNRFGDSLGTVFRITADGMFNALVSFDDTNGGQPYTGLTLSTDGSFYGTTFYGGTYNRGTVFRVTTNGTLAALISFDGTNGNLPVSPLVQGVDGDFYGVTWSGGTVHRGNVFKITLGGTLTSLAAFDGTNGDNPRSGLLLGTDGNFYGATYAGGEYGAGAVFRVTPDGRLTRLYSFSGGDGNNPDRAVLVQGNDGNFYGTTSKGGEYGYGTIFRLSVPLPPVIQAVSHTGSAFRFAWSAVAGQTYQVQYRASLTQTNWSDLGSGTTATNGTLNISDSITSSPSQRFYQVSLLP